MFKDTQYLYGCNPSDFKNKIYLDALYYKRDKAKALYWELNKKINEDGADYNSTENYELRKREFHVYNAWKHNENLIEEALEQEGD